MIRITDHISLEDDEVALSFIRASGPGGQNVNKLATAVQLRFDLARSPSLSDAVKARLTRIAGRRLTLDGVIVLTADAHRSQERNKVDVMQRLAAMIEEASVAPKPRRPTKPTYASKLRRLDGKAKRSGVKQLRRSKPSGD
ncbi:alternative ribosome rescue aminoacyl-tRNA hydrolase ArfB [Methylovirgula sp. 4M-Z18]|uniref:alternative ribosome rescue aminoacyl-tRNA hydrolase ArfB n=1 Tax=Methylovirgula sp. 4M-Z18 TaxID=2293567 RepID=UPI000E2F4D03|nr:alternative ribosome rescue aminoacyl-tRNA hydrolase ArfB [Methylovirgula sp. 4M-Z18]RFB79336.1 aminoacyl-tRNA hydrolase [Methylovirgula sp. 4M-Z18]